MANNNKKPGSYQYHYNIIHDEADAAFAYNLVKHFEKVNPSWKGFYSDLRLPGCTILVEAQKEIQSAKVNICLTKRSLDRTVESICSSAVHNAIKIRREHRLIFIAHSGYSAEEVCQTYGLPTNVPVVEIMTPEDLGGLIELTEKLKIALDRPKGSQRLEKMPVEETALPGHHPQQMLDIQRNKGNPASPNPTETPEQVFRAVLIDLAKELTSADVKSMAFLLNLSQRDSGTLQTSEQVLEFVEKTHQLSHNNSQLLIEMLNALDREDLANTVRKHSTDPVRGAGLSPYRQLVFSVMRQLEEQDVQHLKQALIKSYDLAPRPVTECKSGLELFRLLEQEDLISENDTEKTSACLKYLAKFLADDTQASVLDDINSWWKSFDQVEYSVDDSLEMKRIDEMKKFSTEFKVVLDSFINCDIEMFEEMEAGVMKKYYDQNHVLGQGAFGIVYQGAKQFSDVDVAVKVSRSYNDKTKQFMREKIFASMKHHALMPILAVCDSPQRQNMIMYPHMKNGDLSQWLKKVPAEGLSWKQYVRILTQIADALDFLHTPVKKVRGGIRHGDVKPSNILLDSNLDARLGDAGLADELDLGQTHHTATGVEGTHLYYDIHTYNEVENKYEKKLTNDVYAFGIIALQVFSGISSEPLYHRKQEYMQAARMGNLKPSNIWPLGPNTDAFRRVVIDCISEDVSKRKQMADIVTVLWDIKEKSGIPTAERNPSRCVQCLVNRTATSLPCSCGCAVFCQNCLKRSYCNPLRCPTHGPKEPPIGHSKVFAVLAAPSSGDDKNTFNNDVGNMYRTLTDPKIMGIKEDNVFQLGMDADRRQKFRMTTSNLWEVLDQLKSKLDDQSILILYITCHADAQHFKLCDGLVSRQEVVQKLSEMPFKTLWLICDCCCAADNLDVMNKICEINKIKNMSDRNVYQWFSCCSKQQSYLTKGESIFTSCIIKGLSGLMTKYQDILFSSRTTQYIAMSNLEKYVNQEIEEYKGKNKQIPRYHTQHCSEFKVAYYNSPKQLQSTIMFRGLEGQKQLVKLERRPRHYLDLDLLKKHILRDVGDAYSGLDGSFLQIVKGEDRELSDSNELHSVMEERLSCRFRQNYIIQGRPMVQPTDSPADWHACLLSFSRFISQVRENEYHVTLKPSGCRPLQIIADRVREERNGTTHKCLSILHEVLEEIKDSNTVTVKVHQHFVTFKL